MHDGPGTTVRPSTTAFLCLDSGDRFDPKATSIQNSYQTYNDFTITKNQNLLQGKFTRLQLTDVRFPWAIPNITPYNNTLGYKINGGTEIFVVVAPGFYTGTTLASTLQQEMVDAGASAEEPNAQYLEVSFNSSTDSVTPNGQFVISAPTAPAGFTFELLPATYISGTYVNTDPRYTASLLYTLGMTPGQFTATTNDITTFKIRGWTAPLLYTSYVDIVSEQLTGYQRVKDSSTSNLTVRNAIICRLFVNNEISTDTSTSMSGTFPFTIYRQFKNAKVFRWNGENAVGQIDIKLYDQWGNPLYIPTHPTRTTAGVVGNEPAVLPDFQINFLCSEE
jgi:hypothetical protein